MKINVIDTSVLISDPGALSSFTNSLVILPIVVLEELDKLKKFSGEVGKNARLSIKYLDELSSQGNIVDGINLPGGVKVRVDSDEPSIAAGDNYGDNKILSCALKLQAAESGNVVTLISQDINLRVRAKALGLQAGGHQNKDISSLELYRGCKEIVSKTLGEKLHSQALLEMPEFIKKSKTDLHPNEFVLINDPNGDGISTGRRVREQIKLTKSFNPWNLVPRNKEQMFLIDLIMDPLVSLVSVIGMAGSGKSLISIACCLELVLHKKMYKNLIVCRPIQTIGNELGFLPGSLSEKIAPYYNAMSDALSYLFATRSNKKEGWKDQLYQYIDSGVIQFEPVTYMRGRSIPNALILIDEAQNLSREEIKTILTRAGENSKIILTGDIEQIDMQDLDASNNGLTYIVESFKSYELAGHITLIKGERSELASLASQIL